MDMTNKKTYFDLLDKLYDGTTTEAENQQLDSLTGRNTKRISTLTATGGGKRVPRSSDGNGSTGCATTS